MIKATEEAQARLPDNAAIFQAMTSISPKEIHTRQDVTQLAGRFKNPSGDTDAVNNELRQMKLITVPGDLNENHVKYWAHFQQYKDAALYPLPYSNAEVERVFSKMNCFKSKLRNKMGKPNN